LLVAILLKFWVAVIAAASIIMLVLAIFIAVIKALIGWAKIINKLEYF